MTQSLVTSAIPFKFDRADRVDAKLKQFRPELFGKDGLIRVALRDQGVHFMSITVVRGDVGEPTYLVFEMSVDGEPQHAFDTVGTKLASFVSEILSVAEIKAASTLSRLLTSHHIRTGQGLFDVPGLDFCGTPGMTVTRIKREYALARELRSYFDTNPAAGAPLDTVLRVRDFVKADADLAPLLDPEPFPRLTAEEAPGLDFGFILSLAFQGLIKFFWPVLFLLGLLVVTATIAAGLSQGFAVGVIAFIVSTIVAAVAILAIVANVYLGLRRLESANTPVDTLVDPDVMASLTEAENLKDTQQNHLAGISVMQAGALRGLTLRIAFWVIGQMATKRFRPGFLGDISTIHYARWLRLPKTNKLLFFSNYGGSWESYLEDFITRASNGLTAVWSNTVGFPRTENLFFKGATDGDRFKRWARRQQQPTWFWYSAYPHLTTARIRTNAAIRQGLGTVSTEDEAAAWLGLFGSKVRPATLIETFEVQTLLYGGLSKHPYARCLAIKFSDDPKQACAWLKSIEDQITFGDQPPADKVLIFALTADGLKRLGLPSDVGDSFPTAFRLGMGSPGRANLLADTGDDKAGTWLWGGPEKAIDATLLLYADSQTTLVSYASELSSGIDAAGGKVLHQVTPTPLPQPRPGETAAQIVREPFGFADGISQPIIKGTRRWMRQSDAIHAVEPGEFLLGYPDTRGFFPPSPQVPAAMDHDNLLPLADPKHSRGTYQPDFEMSSATAARDLGRNGTFLVIRQLAQYVDVFNDYVNDAAARYAGHPAIPDQLEPQLLPEWIGAKMVGRWKDGSSLVRYPNGPATGKQHGETFRPDNDFLPGAEDPLGARCPLGAHIRRSNPRDSLAPGSKDELSIVNRHRILRVGRGFDAVGGSDPEEQKPGLLFMCLNADIERQFEFVQQTWATAWQFHGLENEVDPITGRGGGMGRLTIPSARGPLNLTGIKDFVRMRGGAYLFMPSRSAVRFLARIEQGPDAEMPPPREDKLNEERSLLSTKD
ncbi:Dyp-type peroxidase [Rhizobium mesoamericanum]|uniref:Cytochrome P450-like protein n=1 Tax=Rhizobium mesoamericanum STM3625 TaxID=1211777 RepID=K0PTI1_9HYPH